MFFKLAAILLLAAMPNVTMQPSRFSGPGVYTGKPALQVTLSMVEAGGGPSDFKTVTLVKTLTGDKFNAEVGKLTNQYGKQKVGNFLNIFEFIVSDTLKIVKQKGEEHKIAIRNERRDAKEMIEELVKAGDLAEDEGKKSLEKVQAEVDAGVKKVDETIAGKEKDLMQV